MVKKVWGWVERHEWLAICMAIVVLLRIPSLFEPYWYGDEGIYLAIGQALRKGLVLYSQIHDNKPPFLYLIAALANGQIFWFKLWAGIFNLVTIGVFYKLAARLLEKKRVVVATWIFALLTTLSILEGNIANSENFFLLFTVSAFYLLWTNKSTFWGGLVLGLGALFKMPPIFEVGIWPVYWLITRENGTSMKKWFKKSVWLGIGVLLPIIMSGMVMWGLGAGKEYLRAAWAQNLPYLTSWKATTTATGIYSLKNRGLILGLGFLMIFGIGKRWQKETVMMTLWALITWFAALLSGRPYPHYLLQMAPVMAWGGVTRKSLVVGGTLLAMTWASFAFYVYPVGKYYWNFGNYILGRKSKTEYWQTFNSSVVTNYQIAEKVVLNTKDDDNIFVWGDEPMIYALARRQPVGKYLVKYHIKDLQKEGVILKELLLNKPKIIVLFDNANDFGELKTFTSEYYYKIDKIGGADLWKLKG